MLVVIDRIVLTCAASKLPTTAATTVPPAGCNNHAVCHGVVLLAIRRPHYGCIERDSAGLDAP